MGKKPNRTQKSDFQPSFFFSSRFPKKPYAENQYINQIEGRKVEQSFSTLSRVRSPLTFLPLGTVLEVTT